MRKPVASPNSLPDEARAAAWAALWRRLLQPIPEDESEPADEAIQDPDGEAAP